MIKYKKRGGNLLIMTKWDRAFGPRKLSLLPMFLSTEGYKYCVNNYIGRNIKYRFVTIKESVMDAYDLKEEYDNIASDFIEKIKKGNFVFFERIIKKFYLVKRKFIETTRRINKVRHGQMPNEKLSGLFMDYVGAYEKTIPYAPIPRLIDLSLISLLTDIIKEKFKQKAFKETGRDVNEAIAKLVSSDFVTEAAKEELSAYKIALGAIKNKGRDINKLLEKHAKRFCWISMHVEGEPFIEKSDFEKNISELRNSKGEKEIIDRIDYLKKRPTTVRKERKSIAKKLGLNKKEKKLVNIVMAFSIIKSELPDIWGYTSYNVLPLYREIAKRLGTTFSELKFLTPSEIRKLLKEGEKADKAMISERMEQCIIWMERGILTVHSGTKAKEIIERELSDWKAGQVDEIKGLGVSPGIARGHAKILKGVQDASKVSQGDILVVGMTTPDLTIALKKAAGIVTNEGGVTCHAAIISRELKVPCVVGAKNATAILHDNDVVEVDGSKGIVKMIKRAE